MYTTPKLGFLCAFLGSATACASLEAKVSVFDASQLDPLVVLYDSLPRIEAHVAPSRLAESQEGFHRTVRELTATFIELGRSDGVSVISQNDVPEYLRANRDKFERALLQREKELAAASTQLAQARHIPVEARGVRRAEALARVQSAQEHFLAADLAVHAAIDVYDVDLESLIVAFRATPAAQGAAGGAKIRELAMAKAKALRDLRAWVRQSGEGFLTRTQDFLADSRTAQVVGAPDACWRAVYNKVYGGGRWGNVDIAVIKETAASHTSEGAVHGSGLPEFSLKGVRVDSGTVTRATFAGIKEALNIAALAFGVPPATTSSGTAQAPAAPVGDAEQLRHEATRMEQEVLGALDAWLLSGETAYAANQDLPSRERAITALRNSLDPLRAPARSTGGCRP
jgi:hypothetical protein